MYFTCCILLSNKKHKEEYTMKHHNKNRNLSVVRPNQPAYPNAAEPGYFANRALNVVTALVSGMGFVSAMLFLVTMV